MTRRMQISNAAVCLGAALALTGCGMGPGSGSITQTVAPVSTGRSVTGVLRGGQQAISGSTIQLYAVGITGLKSASTPLVSATVKTDGGGNFSISGQWNCTSNTAAYGNNPELYIVATGGNPGLTAPGNATINNTSIALMAALGPCNTINASTDVFINEVTTIAAVWALAPFMADYAHVGAQGAGAAGLINAFSVARMLADTTSGTVPGPNMPANGSVSASQIYNLADMIAACINSNGTGSPCGPLFSMVVPAGATTLPADTIAAALDLAHNPGLNVSTLFKNIPTASPFQPTTQNAPNDWTIAVSFNGGGINSPAGIAIDAGGDAWIANAGGNSVTELGPTGALLTGAGGYTANNALFGAQGIAVDKTGNVWVADTLLSSVFEISLTSGVIQSSASFTAGGISGPIGIAVDSQNNIWVANFAGGSLTELNSAGNAVGASPLTANMVLQSPFDVALDLSGNAWLTDNSASAIAEFANNQNLLSGTGYTDTATLAPTGLALDASGRAWVAESGTNAISLFAPGGNPLLATPLMGGGLNNPSAVAIDGAGMVWVANGQTAGSISQIAYGSSAPLSPSTGFGVLNQPQAIAVDGSGNVWTANSGDNTVSLFVGLASPTVTPLAAAGVGP